MSWNRDNLIENKLKKTTKLFFKNKTNVKNEIKKSKKKKCKSGSTFQIYDLGH
jgi:hypothetical protein